MVIRSRSGKLHRRNAEFAEKNHCYNSDSDVLSRVRRSIVARIGVELLLRETLRVDLPKWEETEDTKLCSRSVVRF